MSSSTKTHHAYNTSSFKPTDGAAQASADHTMAEGQVIAHEDRQQAKKYQNQEAGRSHLGSSIPQTEASSSADAHAGRNFVAPDDDRYSGSDKKFKGKPNVSRANKKQIAELKKMSEEMKNSQLNEVDHFIAIEVLQYLEFIN